MIAKELYLLQQEVDDLERNLSSASAEEKQELEERLRKVRAERDRMRGILEGNKDPSPYRKAK